MGVTLDGGLDPASYTGEFCLHKTHPEPGTY